MAETAGFPTIANVLQFGNNTITVKAATAVYAGQVVGFNATGVDYSCSGWQAPMAAVLGVALEPAAADGYFACALDGCIVKVWTANTAPIDAGDWVAASPYPGYPGSVYAPSSIGYGNSASMIGIAMEDFSDSASQIGRVLIRVQKHFAF